jgi:hypothetical protein
MSDGQHYLNEDEDVAQPWVSREDESGYVIKSGTREEAITHHLNEIEKALAPWLPRENETGEILDAAVAGAAELSIDTSKVQRGLILQQAETKSEIGQIAQPVELAPRKNDTVRSYRDRVLTAFQNLTQQGTRKDLLELTSTLFNINKEQVEIRNSTVAPVVVIVVPVGAVDTPDRTRAEIVSTLLTATAEPFGIRLVGQGTLEYITPEELAAGDYDITKGYADSASDDGGTYSNFNERQ